MTPRRDDLDPAAALRHPLWWAALGALILNDHLLKGAGVLPGWLTGKLSDLAGMIVAPALAASLVTARREGLRALAFVSVAALFALVKLSPEARDALVSLASLAGLRWRIVADPTDLVALAALPLAWRIAAPSAAPRRIALQRSGMALGAMACIATSQPTPTAPAGAFSARAFVVNRTGDRLDLGLRFSTARIDCAAAQLAGGTVFARSIFDDNILRVTLDAGETFPLDADAVRTVLARSATVFDVPVPQGQCAVALLTANAMPETVVLWPLSLPARAVAGFDPGDSLTNPGLLAIADEGSVTRVRSLSGAVSVQGLAQEGVRCERRGGFYSWSDGFPIDPVTLRAVEENPGGCLGLTLETSDGAQRPWFLCVPRAAFPFAVGDRVLGIATPVPTGRRMLLRSGDTSLVVWRNARVDASQVLPDVNLRADLGTLCAGHREDCGAYLLPRSVRFATVADAAIPGERGVEVRPGVTVHVGRADHVLATRDACGATLADTGIVLDYAVTTRGL